MSDIDTQIENNKWLIKEFEEKIKTLNTKIAAIKEGLTNKTIKMTDILKQIDLIRKQIKDYTTNIKTLKGLNKKLEQVKPTQSKKNTDDDVLLEELDKIVKEENAKKAQQQQQNLSEREKAYEDKTGKTYNPLVTDDDKYVTLSEPSVPKPSVSSSKTRRKTPTPPIEIDSTPTTEKNKTKKNRPTPEGIELDDLSRVRETPEQVPLEDVEIKDEYFQDFKKDLTPTPEQVPLEDDVKLDEKTGFSETLVKPSVKAKGTPNLDKNVCKNIFENGSKVNKAHFFPSEFPKLTRINPITVSNKKGGKRKTRKNRKTKNKVKRIR
jgi:hypothetical protein